MQDLYHQPHLLVGTLASEFVLRGVEAQEVSDNILKGLGFRGLGFRVWGFRGLGV